jgi:hypothetical protein
MARPQEHAASVDQHRLEAASRASAAVLKYHEAEDINPLAEGCLLLRSSTRRTSSSSTP